MRKLLEETEKFKVELKVVEDIRLNNEVSTERTMTVFGKIFEKFGKVFISWDIPYYFPIRSNKNQFIELYKGNQKVYRTEVLEHVGTINTGISFDKGYHFEFSVYADFPESRYLQVLKSNITK